MSRKSLDSKTALLILDLQQAIDHPDQGVRNNHTAEKNARLLLDAWRANGWPIVHVRHDSTEPASHYRPGQPGNDFKEIVAPWPGETVLAKRVNSAFIGTDLASRVAGHRLVVCGVKTNNSVEATVRMAGNLGFEVWLVADACFSFGAPDYAGRWRDAEDWHLMALGNLNGEYCRVVTMADVLAALPSQPDAQ